MVSTIYFLVAVLVPIALGLRAIKRCAQLSTWLAAAWQEEYAVRRCAQLAATNANLRAAALYVRDHRPSLALAATSAASDLATNLGRSYPGVPQPQTDGECWPPPGSSLAAALHAEHAPHEPLHWPNWLPIYFSTLAVPVPVTASSAGEDHARPLHPERGAMSLVLLTLIAATLTCGLVAAMALLIRGANRGLVLFDAHPSALYCTDDLQTLATSGPEHGVEAPGGAFACLLPRSDYAAPGPRRLAPPPPLCALLHALHLPMTFAGEPPCV